MTNGSDLHDRDDWRDYLAAARRKVEIAEYHLACLRAQSAEGRLVPSIGLQANFEGVLFAFVAAEDQTAEAINQRIGLGLNMPNLRKVLRNMADSVIKDRLAGWHDPQIARDVRDLRPRAIHHHYVKRPSGPTLEVQDPLRVEPYQGPRDLVSYAEAAVTHLLIFRSVIDELEEALSAVSSPM